MPLAFIRSCLFMTGYTFLTIVYGSLSVFVWLFPPLTRHRIITFWTILVIRWLRISCGVRYRIIGRENIPAGGEPFVILSKHQSTWETLFLQGIFWPSATVLKKELLRIPFFGWGLRALQPIAIDRSNPRQALKQVKDESTRRLKSGLNIILFPEGTRTPPGESGTYARSGADIAKQADALILPIAVNSGACWPSNSFTKYSGVVTVSIGPVIHPRNQNSRSLINEVETWIENEMTQLPPSRGQ